jgi:membrane-associated protease RseP (regulator of RpoE activity)
MVSFFYYDLMFLIVFAAFCIIFLYRKRKNVKKEGVMYLYRTQIGVDFIDYVGKKYGKVLNVVKYFAIGIGYLLTILMIYFLLQTAYIYIIIPQIVKTVDIPPIAPLIPYFPDIYGMGSLFPPFPFIAFFISILVIMTVHEFSHGIFARYSNVRIKSTGFGAIWLISDFFGAVNKRISKTFKLKKSRAFSISIALIAIILILIGIFAINSPIMKTLLILLLVPFLGAFVEQDDKDMEKRPIRNQMAILAGGVFANVVTGIIFIFVMFAFVSLAFAQNGATFDYYTATQVNLSSIYSIEGHNVSGLSSSQIINLINGKDIQGSRDYSALNSSLLMINTSQGAYFLQREDLISQLEENLSFIAPYNDLPAMRAGLVGAIIEIDGDKIKNPSDLSAALEYSRPGQEIKVVTKMPGGETNTYNLKLGKSPLNESKGVIGVSYVGKSRNIIMSTINIIMDFVENPHVNYEARFDPGLASLIRNLLWWIIVLNFLVAVSNMIPAGIFDGGRFFMLTIWGITKNKKIAEKSYKIANIVILMLVLLIVFFYLLAFIR